MKRLWYPPVVFIIAALTVFQVWQFYRRDTLAYAGSLLTHQEPSEETVPEANIVTTRPPIMDPKCLPLSWIAVTPPVIVGGTGGSGTRGLADMLVKMGYAIGENLNDPLDNQDLEIEQLRPIIKSVLKVTQSLNYSLDDLPHELRENVYSYLCGSIRKTLIGLRSQDAYKLWGWKEPNNMFLLPFWQRMFPGSFYYIHTTRDGRSIAFNKNQNQFRYLGGAFPSAGGYSGAREKKAWFWQKTNLEAIEAADDIANKLGCRYNIVKTEDLVGPNSRVTVENIISFLPVSPPKYDELVIDLVETFTSHAAMYDLDQHRGRKEFKAVEGVAKVGLKKFNYLDEA